MKLPLGLDPWEAVTILGWVLVVAAIITWGYLWA